MTLNHFNNNFYVLKFKHNYFFFFVLGGVATIVYSMVALTLNPELPIGRR